MSCMNYRNSKRHYTFFPESITKSTRNTYSFHVKLHKEQNTMRADYHLQIFSIIQAQFYLLGL